MPQIVGLKTVECIKNKLVTPSSSKWSTDKHIAYQSAHMSMCGPRPRPSSILMHILHSLGLHFQRISMVP